MSRRTRFFVLGASAALITGIGTAGVASYVGLEAIGLVVASSAEELSYIPADTQMLAYVDVRQVMDSELRRKLQPDLSSKQETSELFEQTGINLETDVDSVFVAVVGSASGDKPPLLLARGRFDTSRIESSLTARGGTSTEHAGVRMVANEDESIGVAFIEPGLLAAGTPAAIRLALDARASTTGTIRDNAEVMRLVRLVDDAHTWTVARFDALTGHTPLPPDLLSQLPAITWFAAGGRIDAGLSAVLHAETRDEVAAQDLREVIRGFLALARMQVGQQPALADLVNSLKLSGEGTTVSLGFSVTPQMIDQLGALSAQRPAVPSAGRPLRPLAPSQVRASGIPSI